jgi:Tfp pilus assembly protein PilF
MHAHPKVQGSGLTGLVAAYWRKTLAAVVVVVMIVLGYWFLYAPRGNIVIESFRITRNGNGDQAVESSANTARFANALLRVLNEGDSRIKAPGFGSEKGPPDVEVPGTGMSLPVMMSLMADIAGDGPARINADLVTHDSEVTLFVRIASPKFERDQSFSKTGNEDDLPALFDEASREAVKRISPVTLAAYCLNHRRECEPTTVLEYTLAQPPADDDAQALEMWAWILIGDGKLEAAEQRLKQALALRPDLGWALFDYGILRRTQKKPLDAAGFYRKAIQDPDPLTRAMAYNNLGDLLLEGKDAKGAADAYSAAAANNPRLAIAYANLGYVQFAQHDYDGAVDSFAKASALDASDPMPFIGWATALEESHRELDAFGILEMAVSADSTNADALFYLADWHERFGDKQESMDNYLLVEELSPDAALVQAARTRREGLQNKIAPVSVVKEVK